MPTWLDASQLDSAGIGALAGGAAALCWAVASLIFSTIKVPAQRLNLLKNSVAALSLLLTLLIVGRGADLSFAPEAWIWLILSAILGLVVGDFCYFRSIQILGPRKALVLTLTVPPMTAILAYLLEGEDPTSAWLGMGLTLAGIAWVTTEGGTQESPGFFPGTLAAGLLYGVFGSLGQALGSVFSKKGMNGTGIWSDAGPTLEPLEAAFVRLLAAAVLGLFLLRPSRSELRRPFAGAPWFVIVIAGLIGTYGGIWLSLIAYRETTLAIATTMTSLSPIWIIPLIWLVWRRKTSARGWIGAALSLLGVYLLLSPLHDENPQELTAPPAVEAPK